MAYHDEWLSQALELVGKPAPTQADLRRGVSAAHYAVFHLLIDEAVAHWDLDDSRDRLSRMFEHSVMRRVCKKVKERNLFPFPNDEATIVKQLREVAEIVVLLQDERPIADYDNSRKWTAVEASDTVGDAVQAFALWRAIRHQKIAQDFLVALLIKPRD